MSDVKEIVAAAIAREGFPKGKESAREYRLRLAEAAIKAMRDPTIHAVRMNGLLGFHDMIERALDTGARKSSL
jgi:hypothetical protein